MAVTSKEASKVNESRRVAVRLPQWLDDAIEDLRVAENRNMSNMVHTLLIEALAARGIKQDGDSADAA